MANTTSRWWVSFVIGVSSLAMSPSISAETLRVAVASNFSAVAHQLAEQFELETGHAVVLLLGSSGKHVAQIRHGLKVDLFLAADAIRPQALEEDGLIVADSRFTYAVGRLVLWQPSGPTPTASSVNALNLGASKVAVANPKLAPYGAAALHVLNALGYFDAIQGSLVYGENVTQAYQFAYSGHASVAFVAYSQVLARADEHYWLVPQQLHQPITQQAVLLRDTPVARQFHTYLQSTKAMELIRNHGYDTP
ncbi:molybdate ABC transporter substrate-binding protein [Arenicella xantha]|nr:molybdate ABC transporter substrate-binding protein [Arenicella xantha]